jgi:hypothetical protein
MDPALTGLMFLFAIGAQASLDSSYEVSPTVGDGIADAVPVVTTCILPRDKVRDLLEHGKPLILIRAEAIRAASVGSPLLGVRPRAPTFNGRPPASHMVRSPAQRRVSGDPPTDPD